MKKFIRLDMKGHWKGKEHRSSFAGVEEHGIWEEGISCYKLTDGYSIEQLRRYWDEIGSKRKANDFKNMQVTIFEGDLVGEGSDYEDIATCENTIAELNAVNFMGEVIELYESYYFDGDIEEDEYLEKLWDLVKVYV